MQSTQEQKIACGFVLKRMFDSALMRLDAILGLLSDGPTTDLDKLNDVLPKVQDTAVYLESLRKWKSCIFGPDFRAPQWKLVDQFVAMKRELEALAKDLNALNGATPERLKEGLRSAEIVISKQRRKCLKCGSVPSGQSLAGKPPKQSIFMNWVRVVTGISPAILSIVLAPILGATVFFYKAYETKKHAITDHFDEYSLRYEQCTKFGDRLSDPHLAPADYQGLLDEMSKVIEGRPQEKKHPLGQLNWADIVVELEGLGITNRADNAIQAIDDLKIYFLMRKTNNLQPNTFFTNDFHPYLDKVHAFVEANK